MVYCRNNILNLYSHKTYIYYVYSFPTLDKLFFSTVTWSIFFKYHKPNGKFGFAAFCATCSGLHELKHALKIGSVEARA